MKLIRQQTAASCCVIRRGGKNQKQLWHQTFFICFGSLPEFSLITGFPPAATHACRLLDVFVSAAPYLETYCICVYKPSTTTSTSSSSPFISFVLSTSQKLVKRTSVAEPLRPTLAYRMSKSTAHFQKHSAGKSTAGTLCVFLLVKYRL